MNTLAHYFRNLAELYISSAAGCSARFFALALIAFYPFLAKAGDPQFSDIPGLSQAANTTGKSVSGPSSPAASTNAPASLGTNSMGSLDDKYKIAIGDRLSFRIVEDEEDPKPLIVTDSGALEVPYIGRYPAVARTCKELAHELSTELCKEYYYQATVVLAVDSMTKSRGKIYIVGPVRIPGPEDIPSDEVFTLSKAILRAGGFSDFADKKNVRVTRKGESGKGEKNFTVNVAQILEKGKTETDITLEAGDFIYVPERAVRF